VSLAPGSFATADRHRAIIVAGLLATYMQAVNVSLPNAASPYIQGALSMADDEVGWVLTSYIAASLITMPMANWLGGHFGRKAVFLVSIAVFAIGLVLATRAATPIQFVAARIVQGAASGFLAPLSIEVLLDTLPPGQHARISLMCTAVSVTGIVSGPSIGGWLSEYHGWQSIFYASVPLAIFIFLVVAISAPEKRSEQKLSFDLFGLMSFSLGMIGLQMVLDRGERLEWFDSTEIWLEAFASALGFYFYLLHAWGAKSHFLNVGLFRDRNFVLPTILFFVVGFVLLPTPGLTSPMLGELLNYPADITGYMALPRSITLVGALILTVWLLTRVDYRLLVASGMILVVYANWRMLGYSPVMDWRPVIIAGVLQGAGLGILLSALTKAAFSTLDVSLRPEGAALFNLSRFYGSTIGIALVQVLSYNNTQAMHLALAKNLTPYRAAAHVTSMVALATLATLNDVVTRQAAFIGFLDQFEVLMIAMLAVSPLVLFLQAAPKLRSTDAAD
jgi:DHA2 family multidrug resistance protein